MKNGRLILEAEGYIFAARYLEAGGTLEGLRERLPVGFPDPDGWDPRPTVQENLIHAASLLQFAAESVGFNRG